MYLFLFLFIIIILFKNIRWSEKSPKYRKIDTYNNHAIKLLHHLNIFKFNKKKGYEILSIIHKIFNQNNIFFWLSEGTALGFKRNNDFIDYDDDLDLGMWYHDKEKLLNCIPTLKSNGIYLSNVELNGSFYSFIYKNEKIDLDLHSPNHKCSGIFFGSNCRDIIPYLKKFDQININDLVYNLPKNSYFEKMYGKNWKIPIKKKLIY